MHYGKRVFAVFLTLVLVFGMIPVSGSAAETLNTENNVSVGGTNNFGTMLSDAISDAQQSQDAGVETGTDLAGKRQCLRPLQPRQLYGADVPKDGI